MVDRVKLAMSSVRHVNRRAMHYRKGNVQVPVSSQLSSDLSISSRRFIVYGFCSATISAFSAAGVW